VPKTIYSEEHKLVAARIKQAREESGLKQEAVAKILGRTQSYISKIESGQIRIDINLLTELAKVYKKDIEFFLKY
jgi:transcriptional regulator with XRE-family HTH domain